MKERIEQRVFLSHATADKGDVQKLRKELNDRGIGVWEDVLDLRLGDHVGAIEGAIRAADGFLLLLTPASIGSKEVRREVAWAMETKLARPEYVLLPVVRGLDRDALELLFGAAPLVSFALGDEDPIETAVPAIAQAVGLAPQDATARPDPVQAPPLAELVIEIEEPSIREEAGTRRAAGRARVRYVPADRGRGVDGARADFVAPLGPIEAADLRWYLEAYGVWPFGTFKDRAEAIEAKLPSWGRQLFDAVLGRAEAQRAFDDWRRATGAERRITVRVDDRGGAAEEAERLRAAAEILALPWELLADGEGYLFEGNLRARVRRSLPSERSLEAAEPRLPLRVLLVLARPEGERGAGFIDPRVSAIPLARALDPLGEAVELTVLGDGTVKALRGALDAAERAGKPFQVVHFDGHGIYDELRGLGQLCFENADDAAAGKLARRVDRVDAKDIGALLRDRRVALFVLEACQTAMTEESPTASVAAELLKAGAASVVAMSHAVLVETARRFVGTFYGALAEGERIGSAMVRAQHALKDHRARGEIRGTTFELCDWMVPVLFQEDADARLFPGGVDTRAAAIEDRRRRAEVRRGELPEPPAHGFVGRAKALFGVDRMLRGERRWVAIVGGGGLGKTALAAEAARWLLAMRRVERVAFVSVEAIGDARAVLDAIGRQVVAGGYSVAVAEGTGSEGEKRNRALLPVKGELARRRVLIVVDNLESVLPRPGEALEGAAAEILGLIRALSEVGETRVILTSREAAPAPLEGNVLVLPPLGAAEATAVIAGVLRAKGLEPRKAEEDKEGIAKLVEAVGGHARSLVLLGELVAEKGVTAVAEDVRGMMGELEKRYPEERERSLIASVRLSLRRLPEGVREKIRALAVFHGAAHYAAIAQVLEVEPEEALELCRQLVAVGLAGADGPYLLPDPALGAALAGELTEAEWEAAEARCRQATRGLVGFLYEQQFKDAKIARHGARVALTEFMAALAKIEAEIAAGRGEAEEAMGYVTSLESLVSSLGVPRVLERVGEARERLSKHLLEWGHERFLAESEALDRRLEQGDLQGALDAARALCNRAEAAGHTFPEAAFDRAVAWFKLGRMLSEAGHAPEALDVLDVARGGFSALAAQGSPSAARMESATITERGDALLHLGRLDDAAAAYEERVASAKKLGDLRGIAVGSGQLGTVRLVQRRFGEALGAYMEAQATFEALGEPEGVTTAWHQIGILHAEAGNLEAAEQAYKEALKLQAARGNLAGEARTLHQLANLYDDRGRLEDAVAFYQQAVEIERALNNKLVESTSLHAIGIVLSKLCRFDEARDALTSALTLKASYGHAAQPWMAWAALEDVEREAGRPEAAREARQQALQTYRAYRLDGGEPMDGATRLIVAFGHTLRTSGPDAARAFLPDLTQVPAQFAPTPRALQALAAGSRDPALADDPALFVLHAVELALLLESLPPANTSPSPNSAPPAPLDAPSPCPCGGPLPFHLCHGAPDPEPA